MIKTIIDHVPAKKHYVSINNKLNQNLNTLNHRNTDFTRILHSIHFYYVWSPSNK